SFRSCQGRRDSYLTRSREAAKSVWLLTIRLTPNSEVVAPKFIRRACPSADLARESEHTRPRNTMAGSGSPSPSPFLPPLCVFAASPVAIQRGVRSCDVLLKRHS